MKLDIFNHIFPQRFYDRMLKVAPNGRDMHKRVRAIPCIVDLAQRFRIMDMFDDYAQVICLGSPPIEVFGPPPVSTELARLANDGMAELVDRHRQRFPAFIASLPMNDPDGAAQGSRARRARARCRRGAGVHQCPGQAAHRAGDPTPVRVDGQARPAAVAASGTGRGFCGLPAGKRSHYEIWWTFGWPYETSVAMAHIVFEGLFDRYPQLKIITHHMGGMIPYFEGRVGPGWDQLGARTSDVDYSALLRQLKRRPVDYFHFFYADTALFGAMEATRCGLKFFGPERVLFASDAPFDPEQGAMYTRTTIEIIDRLDVSPAERHAIYEGNARRLLKLE